MGPFAFDDIDSRIWKKELEAFVPRQVLWCEHSPGLSWSSRMTLHQESNYAYGMVWRFVAFGFCGTLLTGVVLAFADPQFGQGGVSDTIVACVLLFSVLGASSCLAISGGLSIIAGLAAKSKTQAPSSSIIADVLQLAFGTYGIFVIAYVLIFRVAGC